MLNASAWLDGLYERPGHQPRLRLVDRSGQTEVIALPLRRWHGPPGPEELAVLARARGPVLDVGCGPGRHVAALAAAGVAALGIDISEAAVRAARRRRAPAMRASVFEEVPGAREWTTVLLLDGNVGIGGDPVRLLRRCRELLRPDGVVLVEVDPPEARPGWYRARVEHDGVVGSDFAWARLGLGELAAGAAHGGFRVAEAWTGSGRWFARLRVAGCRG